jgi:hypothetical protein
VYESVRLRESIFHTIGQSSSDLESQGKASEYALRKRLHELERSLKELEWQKKQVFYLLKNNSHNFCYHSRQKKKFLVMKVILIVWKKLFAVNKNKQFLKNYSIFQFR